LSRNIILNLTKIILAVKPFSCKEIVLDYSSLSHRSCTLNIITYERYGNSALFGREFIFGAILKIGGYIGGGYHGY